MGSLIKRKSKKTDLKSAFAGLPRLVHSGPTPPPELVKTLHRSYRLLALNRSGLTAAQWRAIPKTGDLSDFRVQAYLDLMKAIECGTEYPKIKDHCPPWGMSLTLKDNAFVAEWTRIDSTIVKGRTLYHWADRKTIKYQSGNYIAGFPVHALLRLCERSGCVANCDLLRFSSMLRLTHCDVDGNGLWLWMRVNETGILGGMIKLLTDTDRPSDYLLRVAYFPIEISGKFAILKTALSPAMMVPQCNANLATMERLYAGSERAWHEILKLHERLPLVKYSPPDKPNRRPTAQKTRNPLRWRASASEPAESDLVTNVPTKLYGYRLGDVGKLDSALDIDATGCDIAENVVHRSGVET